MAKKMIGLFAQSFLSIVLLSLSSASDTTQPQNAVLLAKPRLIYDKESKRLFIFHKGA